MIEFKEAELFSVLPGNLKEAETAALSAAVRKGLALLEKYSHPAAVYAAIPALPDEALDLLAVELRTQYYDPAADRQTRENMVRHTIAWYFRGGTGAVLTEYLAALYRGGRLEEWHEYGGKPYFFKAVVELAMEDEMETGAGKRIRERICAYKNVRSWLETLSFHLGAAFDTVIGWENGFRFRTEFYPYNLMKLKLDGRWKLDGHRRLSKYDSDTVPDFYPVAVRVKAGHENPVREGVSGFRFRENIPQRTAGGNGMRIRMGTARGPDCSGTALRVMSEAGAGFQAALSGFRFRGAAGVRETAVCEMSIGAGAEGRIVPAAESRFQARALGAVQNGARMYKQNCLDASWRLGGGRKLDGGFYIL